MPKEIKAELLTWTRYAFPTLYYRHGSQIKTFIDSMEDIRMRSAKLELQKYLLNIHNKQCANNKTL
jgi:hypothetical protein